MPRYSSGEKLDEIPDKMPVEKLLKIRDKLVVGGDGEWRGNKVYFQKSGQK
ncbi:hypothetical protein HYW46_07330 [Candidatus Daviesbacteria bacterium]|nr:hypothetical protein [Candidatus Daviesbacteria bacterium]